MPRQCLAPVVCEPTRGNVPHLNESSETSSRIDLDWQVDLSSQEQDHAAKDDDVHQDQDSDDQPVPDVQ